MKQILRKRLAVWARRRQGLDILPVTVHRRRLYIIPTRAGTSFAFLLLLMLVAGLNYANSLALFLTFLLGGFALVAMHQCHRNLLNLVLSGVKSAAAFAGENATLEISLTQESAFTRDQIEASALDQTATLDLAPRSTQSLQLPLRAARRGILRIERLQLATSFPFGLFRAWTWVHMPIEIVIYPRPRGSLPMPTKTGRKPGTRSQSGIGTEEWLGLRPFRDGDSPRQVAWKAYARGAPLLVKEYSAAAAELRLFDFDQLTQLGTEARLEQLSRWIVDAEARGEGYGLRIGNRRMAPDRGPAHRHRCLTALAMFAIETNT